MLRSFLTSRSFLPPTAPSALSLSKNPRAAYVLISLSKEAVVERLIAHLSSVYASCLL